MNGIYKIIVDSLSIKQWIRDERNNITSIETIDNRIYAYDEIIIHSPSQTNMKAIDGLTINRN